MSHEVIQYLELKRIGFALQVRRNVDDAVVQAMAASLKVVGQLQPVRVRRVDNEPVVVDGELRCRAAKLLGWDEIAAIIEGRELCAAEVTQRQLISNCQRKGLTPLEIAHVMEELMRASGWNASELAAGLGFSNATVSRLLALLSLPETIQEKVQSGAVPASTAYEISKVADPVKQVAMARAAANGDLTRDDASARAKRERDCVTRTHPIVSRVKAMLDGDRSVTVCAPDLVMDSFIAVLEQLLGKARKSKAKNLELDVFVRSLRSELQPR